MEKINKKLSKYIKKCDCGNNSNTELYKRKLNHYITMAGGAISPEIAAKIKLFQENQNKNKEIQKNEIIHNPVINNNSMKELEQLNHQRMVNLHAVFDNINRIIADLNKCLCEEENKRKDEQKKVEVIEKDKNEKDIAIIKMKDNVSKLNQDISVLNNDVKIQSDIIKKLTEMVKSCSNIDVKHFTDLKNLCISSACKENKGIQNTYSELNKSISDFNTINSSIQKTQFNITGGDQPLRKFEFIKL